MESTPEKLGIRDRLKNLLTVNIPYIRVANTKYSTSMFVPMPNDKPPETYANSYYGTHYIWYATEKTSEHDEFSFISAFRAELNHNKPDRTNLGSIRFSTVDTIDSEEFCADTSKEITIIAEDSTDKVSLDNIDIKFICGGFECELGKTETDFSGDVVGEAFLRKKVPYCVAGYAKAGSENYLDTEIPMQTDIDKTYVIPMTAVKTISKYRVVKHSFDGKIVGGEQELSSDERVSITLANKDKSFESVGIYPGDEVPLKLLAKADFKYDVTVYLLKDENVVGGYVNEWAVTWSQLENSNEIVFHVMEHITKDETERFLFVGSLNTYSMNVPMPELK